MGKARILVVDDSKLIRELLKLHLSNAGYEVETAEDAIDAGRQVLQEPPHLIITDVDMPYMNGIEFITALRADDEVPDIPVIFLSANRSLEGAERRLRAAAWLTKPVSAERLLEVVELQVPQA
jgi:two-component system chemotaxis response regulator CheY